MSAPRGYFNDSELSSIGRPADEREKALLAPFPGVVAPDVMDGTYKPTVSDGSGADRKVLREALSELQAAGYELDASNTLVNKATGTAARLRDPRHHQGGRAAGARLSAHARPDRHQGDDPERRLRPVPAAPPDLRLRHDAEHLGARRCRPGNEQNFRWSQASADTEGSFNFPGAKEPAIDAMIAAMLAAPTREDFVAAVRALDRVLISGYYVVPLLLPAGELDRALDHGRAPGEDRAHRAAAGDVVREAIGRQPAPFSASRRCTR